LHLFNSIRRILSADVNGHSRIKETRVCDCVTHHQLLGYLQLPMLTDFRNFFTAIYNNELRNKNVLKFSPHLKSVAALPCET